MLFDEALHAARSVQDRDETCLALYWWASRETGDRAIELATQALEYADRSLRPYLEVSIAGNALGVGRLDVAEPHAHEAVTLTLETNLPLIRALAIAFCAPFLVARAPEDAALLFGYANGQLRELGWKVQDEEQRALETAAQLIENALPASSYETLAKRGAALRLDEALAVLTPALARNYADSGPSLAAGDGVGTLLR